MAPKNRSEDRSFSPAQGTALGEGVPANVDIHKLGEGDRPEADWGESAGPDAVHSANHTRRPDKTEAERGQGPRTRKLNRDIASRRA